jgi:hypothetical protein
MRQDEPKSIAEPKRLDGDGEAEISPEALIGPVDRVMLSYLIKQD